MGSAGHIDGLITAREAGLVACQNCGQVHEANATVCIRCEGRIASRKPQSLQNVWAWLIAGIITFIPANVYPMLRTNTLVESSESTIIGGVVELIHYGNYGIGAIVFIASILIPLGKFLAIIYLALSVQKRSVLNMHQRHKLYDIVEFIGRWSMIDVFVVAILSALVQLNTVASINPGIAAVSFALSVIFTMLAAQSFDPRMIWDADRKSE
ncbi:paraquat-inducible protein A [Cognatiyoonia koreensis]|uniref:Paraquat-inducible protein A n=1 Tax=Cognatiyoonia koreensis TaxID=364200 RepID=A0A1I0NHQ9_9RHOB|nr:paraquat-inducible protein A [Cognatiyoonia koreensis]SEW00845.1 paraquat-inducible protein A [Cognatiyoonia koreensis]